MILCVTSIIQSRWPYIYISPCAKLGVIIQERKSQSEIQGWVIWYTSVCLLSSRITLSPVSAFQWSIGAASSSTSEKVTMAECRRWRRRKPRGRSPSKLAGGGRRQRRKPWACCKSSNRRRVQRKPRSRCRRRRRLPLRQVLGCSLG